MADDATLDDDAWLDDVFDGVVDVLASGGEPDLDDALRERPHLRAVVEAAAAAAHELIVEATDPPANVPGYDVLNALGSGGMGTVYLAREQATDRLVALKVMAGPFTPTARQRFRAEAAALRAIRHEHVVAVHTEVETQDLLAFAMDWVDGWNLGQFVALLRGGGDADVALPDVGDFNVFVCRTGIAIARALATAHRAGLLHRDVKPGNILIDRAGRPLLTDFGLVRGDDAETLTQTGAFVGTAAYAAPEQLRGARRELSPRTDVYGLGATLYECLTGALPYGAGAAPEILRRVERGELTPLRRRVPHLPRDLETIVHRAMAERPAERYESADALADDLERLLAMQPIAARPPTLWRRARRFAAHRPLRAAAALVLAVGLPLAIGGTAYAGPRLAAAWTAERRAFVDEHVGIGWQQLLHGDARSALAHFMQAREQDPTHVLATAGAIRAELGLGHAEQAQTLFETFPGDAGQLTRVRLRLVSVIEGADAAARYRESMPPPRTAVDFALDALEQLDTPQSPSPARLEAARKLTIEAIARSETPLLLAHLLRCKAARLVKDRDELRNATDAMLGLFPDAAAARFEAALTMRALGDHAAAIEHLTAVLRLRPDDALAHNNLGNALHAAGRPVDALAEFDRALELDGNYAIAYYNRGLALRDLGRLDDAIAACRTASVKDPKFAEAVLNLGVFLVDRQRYAEALAPLQEYAATTPSPRAHYNLGLAHAFLGSFDDATEHLRAAAQAAGKVTDLHRRPAEVLMGIGRTQEAIALLRSALDSGRFDGQPKDRDALTALLQKAEAMLGVDAVLAGTSPPPSTADEWFELAGTASLGGRFGTATDLAQRALALEPEDGDMAALHRVDAALWAIRGGTGSCPETFARPDTRDTHLRLAAGWVAASLAATPGDPDIAASLANALAALRKNAFARRLRDADELAQLPADLAAAWRDVWARLDALPDPPK